MLWLAGTAVMTSTKGRRGSGNWVGWVAGFPTSTRKHKTRPPAVKAAEPNNLLRVNRLLFELVLAIV
jgi:hypothetical protein